MNKVLLAFCFICTLFSSNASQAQFTGKIVYQYEYQNHSNKAIEEQLNHPKIDSLSYAVHKSEYQSVSYSNGEIVETYVYDPASKKMLFSMGNRPYYLYLQTDLDKFDSAVQLEFDQNQTEEILGYSAYKTLNPSTGEINYYAKDIQIDARNFSKHYFMQWNQILKQTNGSLPLKTITRYNGYTEIKTTIRVEPQTEEEMDFSFDERKMQVAAYNNLDEVIDFPELKGQGFWCYQAIVDKHSNRLIYEKDYQLVLRFVIHPDASITHVEIEESEYEYLNEAAKRIIKTCDLGFEPGKINGKPVSSEIYYPINF